MLFFNEGCWVILIEVGELMYCWVCYLFDEVYKVEFVVNSFKLGVEIYLCIVVDIIFLFEMFYKVFNKVLQDYLLLCIELMEMVFNGVNMLLKEGEVDLGILLFLLNSGFSEDLCEIDFIVVVYFFYFLYVFNCVLMLEDLKGYCQIVVRDFFMECKVELGWLGVDQCWIVSYVRIFIDIICQGFGFVWLLLVIICNELEIGVLKLLFLE